MRSTQLNLNSIQKDWPNFVALLKKGEEIILTESNKPVAKISPIQFPKKPGAKSDFVKKSVNDIYTKKQFELNTASEIWLG